MMNSRSAIGVYGTSEANDLQPHFLIDRHAARGLTHTYCASRCIRHSPPFFCRMGLSRSRPAHCLYKEEAVVPSDLRPGRQDFVFRVNYYGIVHAAFRAGAKPTGIRATSFIDLISTAERLLVCSFATLAVLSSGSIINQSSPQTTRLADPISFKSCTGAALR